MSIDWGAQVAGQVEDHWLTSLRPCWAGLTDDEYFWQPVAGCLTVNRRGEGLAARSWGGGPFTMDVGDPSEFAAVPPMTTIAWRLAHLIVGLALTIGDHVGGPLVAVDTFDYAGCADDALRQADDEFRRWLEGVRGLGQRGLSRPQGSSSPPPFTEAPMAQLILYTSAEVIHHGAEVSLLRDLYAHRDASCDST